jgi:hypothetical protein
MVAAISTLFENKEEKKEIAETVDMGKSFDKSKFMDLCLAITKTKQ